LVVVFEVFGGGRPRVSVRPSVRPAFQAFRFIACFEEAASDMSSAAVVEWKVRKQLAKGVGILKVAKSFGLGTGTVQRISNELG
jgi:hypothetical protein